MPSSRLTQDLCARIVDLRFESLSEHTIFKAKEAIRDGLTVSAAGCEQPPVMILADYVRTKRSYPAATVWGHGFKTSLTSAALVNAASIHVLDYEPMSDPSTHAVSPVLPCVMALAEAGGHSGRDVVMACIKGFEIQHRLLAATIQAARADRRFRQFHIAGVVGVMGSVVAAGHLLRLDVSQLCNALGIAASRAGSLTANAGTMTKCAHTGNAAAAGLESALLAQRGFDANSGVLEDENGYIAAFFSGGPFNESELLAFGHPFRITDPGMAYKFFPSKYPTQYAITAALELHSQIGDPARIARVTITTPIMRDVDRPQPRSGLEGKFSFQYVVAVALSQGTVGIESFSDDTRFRSEIVDLLAKIEVVQREEIPADLVKMHVAISVETTDARTYTVECRAPKGHWGVAIKPEEHLAKMRDCLPRLLNASGVEKYIALTDRLEQLDAAEIKHLIQLMSGASVAEASGAAPELSTVAHS